MEVNTVKKVLCLLVILFLTMSSTALAETPHIVLMTCYAQEGWGDRIEVGYVDEEGGLWYFSRESNDLGFPYSADERLDYLDKQSIAQRIGTLDSQTIMDMESLIASVSEDDVQMGGSANDAGTQSSYAVRYAADGAREIILLGTSGDDSRENMDASAQALYALLRQSFPDVTDYAGHGLMAPSGFQTISLMAFMGLAAADLQNAKIEVSDYDCESGLIPREMTDDEARAIFIKLQQCIVTGKRNALSVTGGTILYSILNTAGDVIATLEFYQDTLVRPDGMYTVICTE